MSVGRLGKCGMMAESASQHNTGFWLFRSLKGSLKTSALWVSGTGHRCFTDRFLPDTHSLHYHPDAVCNHLTSVEDKKTQSTYPCSHEVSFDGQEGGPHFLVLTQAGALSAWQGLCRARGRA